MYTRILLLHAEAITIGVWIGECESSARASVQKIAKLYYSLVTVHDPDLARASQGKILRANSSDGRRTVKSLSSSAFCHL